MHFGHEQVLLSERLLEALLLPWAAARVKYLWDAIRSFLAATRRTSIWPSSSFASRIWKSRLTSFTSSLLRAFSKLLDDFRKDGNSSVTVKTYNFTEITVKSDIFTILYQGRIPVELKHGIIKFVFHLLQKFYRRSEIYLNSSGHLLPAIWNIFAPGWKSGVLPIYGKFIDVVDYWKHLEAASKRNTQ